MGREVRGVVVQYDEERGFGFIRARGFSDDVFVHVSDVAGQAPLRPGQRVRFVAEMGDRGPRAARVSPGTVGLTPALASAVGLFGLVGVGMFGLRMAGLPWIFAWLIPINLATFTVWAWDKHRAVRDARRVPESALIGLAIVGGTIGAVIGVSLLGHKRRKPRFLLALGVVATLQLLAIGVLLARS